MQHPIDAARGQSMRRDRHAVAYCVRSATSDLLLSGIQQERPCCHSTNTGDSRVGHRWPSILHVIRHEARSAHAPCQYRHCRGRPASRCRWSHATPGTRSLSIDRSARRSCRVRAESSWHQSQRRAAVHDTDGTHAISRDNGASRMPSPTTIDPPMVPLFSTTVLSSSSCSIRLTTGGE